MEAEGITYVFFSFLRWELRVCTDLWNRETTVAVGVYFGFSDIVAFSYSEQRWVKRIYGSPGGESGPFFQFSGNSHRGFSGIIIPGLLLLL